MVKEELYTTNYKPVTVKTSDGSVHNGRVNICDYLRFSDFLRNTSQFITMISSPDEPHRVTMFNKNSIVFAEPGE
jgi:hypothetical protein